MSTRTATLLLQIIVLIFGFTSILGRLISYDSLPLVWWRLLIVSFSLGVYFLCSKKKILLNKNLFLKILGTGFIVGIHWVFFYGGIKTSNISITMIAFSSGTFFTALLEPLFYKRKINWKEILIGLSIFGAIGYIGYHEFESVKNPLLGIVLGALAALTSSLFSILNGRLIQKSNAFTITFIELLSAFFWISIILFLFFEVPENLFTPTTSDLIYLLVLGILCTAIPFLISVEIMKKLTPFTLNLSLNLEVIYAILMAYFIFREDEKMTPTFYIGAIFILCLIVLNEFLKRKSLKK